jgi:3-isopropylmalate/(R)-2-methylmalate dehydratase small subunit
MEALASPSHVLRVDLEAQTITGEGITPLSFTVEPFRKHCLLHGLDDIGLTLAHLPAIAAFEDAQRADKPWLYGEAQA